MSEVGVPHEDLHVLEAQEPIGNLVEKLNGYFYARGQVTREARFGHSEQVPNGQQYPLFARSRRADLYHRIAEIRAEDDSRGHSESRAAASALLQEAHNLDDVLRQYLTQSELHVPMTALGEATSKHIHLKPPDPQKNDQSSQEMIPTLPPIFLIGGIANDVECVGNLAVELALRGREVHVVGYPDSYNGSVSSAFAEAVNRDEAFGPHAEYFAQALQHTIPSGEVEVWGYSTGCPIAAQVLAQHPDIAQRTKQATLIAPASTHDQSTLSVKLGVVRDIGFVRTQAGLLPNMSWTTGRRDGVESEEHEASRKQSFGGLLYRVARKSPHWSGMRVAEGGHIAVVSGGKDEVVKSYKGVGVFGSHANARVISLPDAHHATAIVQPTVVLDALGIRSA